MSREPLAPPARSVEALALGVLMPSFAGRTLPDDYAALLADGLGGICLFGSNMSADVRALTDAIHAAGLQAIVTIDEEGGDVTRLHALTGSPVLGAAALGAAGSLDLTRSVGAFVGAELAAAGIDLDLAPDADVNSNPDNPVIGTRSFSSDPSVAAAHVAAWVEGLQSAGVGACVKHFPGHGDTGEDSHLALPVLDAPLGVIRERELAPFIAAVAANTAAVMTSHIVVPALDPTLPATLSAPVLSLLREWYDGVIVSDALDMAGASAGRGIPEAAVLSLIAGADFLCLGPDKPAALVRDTQAAVVRAVEGGRLSRARLEESVRRIGRLPRRFHRPAGETDACQGRSPLATVGIPGRPVIPAEQISAARAALIIEGDLPDLKGATVVSVATPANIAVGEVPWGLEPDVTVTPRDPLPTGPVVVQVRDAHRHSDVLDLLDGVKDGVVVEWGWPGPYDGALPRICTRGHSRPGVAAVTDVLREAGWDR